MFHNKNIQAENHYGNGYDIKKIAEKIYIMKFDDNNLMEKLGH